MEPIILDGEMDNGMDERGDICCFDPSVLHSSTSNPSREFEDLFLRPSSAAPMSDMMSSKPLNSHVDTAQPGSSPSDTRSDSPEDSSHGSSADSPGVHLRNASLASTQSELFSPSSVGTERYLPAGWPNAEQLSVTDGAFIGQDQGNLSLKGDLTMDTDLELSNNAMASAFDFDSAASSPSPLKLDMITEKAKPQLFRQAFRGPSCHTRRTTEPNSSQSQPFTPAVNPFVFRQQGGSPAFVPEHTAPNSKYWENRSTHSSLEETFGGINMNSGSPLTSTLSPSLNFRAQGQQAFEQPKYPPGVVFPMNDPAAAIFHPNISLENYIRPQLIVHPTSLKSRVETQIPIKMTLYPMPPGVKKLRLPSHAISKPKFLAKSDTERSPEILELRASVVCTSAMQDKKKRDKAFARARGEHVNAISPKDNSSEDMQNDDDTPLAGAEVKICSGCIQRERKRASRKKQRKPEEDELFQKDEEKRVVVFNTTELKDWTDPPRTTSGGSDPASPGVPLGAMQVELPMRIACYCRHQNEKVGFQVIFSINDHMDNIVAQGATNSIMITDDHKTHTATNYAASSNPVPDPQFPTAGVFPANPAVDMGKPFIHQSPYKFSHSAGDLNTLRNRHYPLTPAPSNHSQSGVSGAAVGLASRNLSRQASPTDLSGPMAKRRKQSGSGKVPQGLTMTKMETSHTFSGPSNSTPTSNASPLPSNAYCNGQSDQPFVNSSMAPQTLNGPPTPNNNDPGFFSSAERSHSFESQSQQQLMSAPSSAQPSRPGTPGSSSRSMSHDQSSTATSVQNSAWDAPPSLPPHQVPSMIHKLVPAEGSTTGGTEVTLLGSGFYPGMEVVFGDTLATTTTFWGEKCLNCLTPPSLKPGSVPVVFKHEHPLLGQHQPGQPIMPKPQIFFRYVDDRELQMYRIALGILGQKLRNPADAFQTAQQIMGGDSNNLWNLQSNFQNNGQQRQAPANNHSSNVTELDAKMLVYLEFMDLDDSPGSPKYNSRSPSGQTLLHLASSLGLTRFVAGLLARGANPDVRDNNYNTPLHLAALSGHTHMVHRLRLAGADVSARNLSDFTPADLATSLPTHQAVLVPSRHYRSRSADSTPSARRRPSSGSLDMFWENSSSSGDLAELSSDESDKRPNAESRQEQNLYFTHSRNGSVPPPTVLPSNESEPGIEVGSGFSPPAALVAWRNQLAGQINQFQQNVNRAFPNLPALPPMPALPDYQTHPMIQRISSLVPHRPTTSWSSNIMKDGWDRLTGTMSPPAYEDLYPAQDSDEDYSVKKSSMVEAAMDAAVDQHFTSQAESSSSRPDSAKEDMGDVRIGRKNISRQQQDQLRKTHARKMKRIRSDRNLFFIWIPLLILIVVAMLKNLIPDIWHGVKQGYEVVKSHYTTGSADTYIRT